MLNIMLDVGDKVNRELKAYGANIKLPDAGTYELTITIHSPADNDYLIHSDALTGPGGTFDDYFKNGEPLSVTKTWEYTGPVKV